MPRRALAIALAVLTLAPAGAGAADETLTPRVDALRTGFVDGSPLRPPLKLRWQADLGEVASVPVVTAGKVVYVRNPGTGRRVTALDAATGAVAWDLPLPGSPSAYPELSAADGRLLVSAAELLTVLDLQTGRQLWQKRYETGYPEGYASSYAVGRDGVVYAIRDTGTATLYALRGSDGAQLWTARIISGTSTGPTVDGDTVYVVQGAGVVQAFSRATGAEKWAYRTCCTGGGGGFGVRTGGVLLANASEPVAHDVRTGQVVGGFTGGLPHVTPSLLVHPMGNGVRATGLDGSPRWSWSPDPYAMLGVATVTPGAVVVTAEDGVLTLDPATGSPTWCAAPVAPPGSGTFPRVGGVAAGQGLLVVGLGYGLFAFENGGTDRGCDAVAPPPPPPAATTTGAAAPGAGAPGAVTLQAGRTDLRLGERTRLTGTAPPGREVRLEVDLHPFDDRWVTGERLRASSAGTFTALATPSRNLRVRAVSGDLASAPVTLFADFPASLRRLGAGTRRPRLRFEVGALPGAKIRQRRVVFYLARRGARELRRIAATRWQVKDRRFVRVTQTYPRGTLRGGDRVLVCTREPAGGDGFGRPSPLDALCGAPKLPLSALRR